MEAAFKNGHIQGLLSRVVGQKSRERIFLEEKRLLLTGMPEELKRGVGLDF